MTSKEFNEKHPKIVHAVKVITFFGGVYVVLYACGVRIEFTLPKDREIRKLDLGYAGNVLNGVHGAQARGLDASKALAKYNAIIAPYI